MINIEYSCINNNFMLDVTGHANSAVYGKDIVCAAVSTIVTNLAELWYPVEDKWKNRFMMKPVIESSDGHIHIEATSNGYTAHMQNLGTWAFVISSLNHIASEYSEYVSIKHI